MNESKGLKIPMCDSEFHMTLQINMLLKKNKNKEAFLEGDVPPGQYVTSADSSIRHIGAMVLKISSLCQVGS